MQHTDIPALFQKGMVYLRADKKTGKITYDECHLFNIFLNPEKVQHTIAHGAGHKDSIPVTQHHAMFPVLRQTKHWMRVKNIAAVEDVLLLFLH